MAEPGWYRDPDGGPGRMRYFDGQNWAGESAPDPRRRRRTALLLGCLIVVAAILIGAVIVLGPDRDGPVADPNPPTSAVSGWDDSRPTATPSPTPRRSASPRHSARPTPSQSASVKPVKPSAVLPPGHCPAAEPTQVVRHPDDARVYGGALSFAAVSGHGFGQPEVLDHFGWWYDEHGQATGAGSTSGSKSSSGSPQQQLAVGTVAIRAYFQTPQQAARTSLACAVRAGGYRGYAGTHKTQDRAVQIDGTAGWTTSADVAVTGAERDGVAITVTVVNAGPPGSYSIFIGTAPLGDSTRTKIITRTAAGLRVDG